MSADGVVRRWVCVPRATDGIGREAALQIAHTGAGVIVHGRDEDRGVQVGKEMRKATGNDHVEFLGVDLASLADVRVCAHSAVKRLPHLDVLANSARVCMNERQESMDGHEMTFAVNCLALFLPTNLLLTLLKKSAPSRIFNVTSAAPPRGALDVNGSDEWKRFSPCGVYASSKLASILFSRGFALRLAGTPVTVNCLQFGVVATKLLSSRFPGIHGRR